MSYSFYIPTISAPIFSALFDVFPQLCLEGENRPEDDRFVAEYFYYVYEDLVSIRSLEIGLNPAGDDGSKSVFSVRIMTASGLEDYQLAIKIAEYVAGLANAKIEGEDCQPLDPAAFRAHFDQDWIDRMVNSGPTALRSMLKSGEYAGPFTLSGTRRPFYFGVDSLEKIETKDEKAFLESYFELARRVQYIDDEESTFAATKMQMRNEDPEKACVFSVWGPGLDYLFPDVDFVSVLSEEVIIIPIGMLDVFTKVEFLDDRHRLVEKTEDHKWDDIIDQARAIKIDPMNPYKEEKNDN